MPETPGLLVSYPPDHAPAVSEIRDVIKDYNSADNAFFLEIVITMPDVIKLILEWPVQYSHYYA